MPDVMTTRIEASPERRRSSRSNREPLAVTGGDVPFGRGDRSLGAAVRYAGSVCGVSAGVDSRPEDGFSEVRDRVAGTRPQARTLAIVT